VLLGQRPFWEPEEICQFQVPFLSMENARGKEVNTVLVGLFSVCGSAVCLS
jgi:hypothetical protein